MGNATSLKKMKDNKKGSTLMFCLFIVTIFIGLTLFVVDIGFAYIGRLQLQNINDASVLAGTNAGKYAFRSGLDGKEHVYIKQVEATNASQKVINYNKQLLNPRITIDSVKTNPSGERVPVKYPNGTIRQEVLNSRDQYYSGNFTIRMDGKYKTLLAGDGIIEGLEGVSFISFVSEARTTIFPK